MLFNTIFSSLGFPSAAVSSLETKHQCRPCDEAVLCPPWLYLGNTKAVVQKGRQKIHLLHSFPQHTSGLGFVVPALLTSSPFQAMTLRTRVVVPMKTRTQSRAATAPCNQHSSSYLPLHAPAWVNVREMAGCEWGAWPGSLGAAPIMLVKPSVEPSLMLSLGLHRLCRPAILKPSSYQHPTQQPLLLHQRRPGHSKAADDTEMERWQTQARAKLQPAWQEIRAVCGMQALADRMVQGSAGASRGERQSHKAKTRMMRLDGRSCHFVHVNLKGISCGQLWKGSSSQEIS